MCSTPQVRAYKRAILNIHPALLPSFGGKGYYGIKVSGLEHHRCASVDAGRHRLGGECLPAAWAMQLRCGHGPLQAGTLGEVVEKL